MCSPSMRCIRFRSAFRAGRNCGRTLPRLACGTLTKRRALSFAVGSIILSRAGRLGLPRAPDENHVPAPAL